MFCQTGSFCRTSPSELATLVGYAGWPCRRQIDLSTRPMNFGDEVRKRRARMNTGAMINTDTMVTAGQRPQPGRCACIDVVH